MDRNDKRMSSKMASPIQQWYSGRSIFITGATGFMGRVLVVKLLRDCPDIKKLYLVIRSKYGVDAAQRGDEYASHMIFDAIRESNPTQLKKLHMITSDLCVEELGMSADNRKLLIDEVSIVFHCAADVRFDRQLKQAVNLNTAGTLRILEFAEQMPHLDVLVHVSTAYSQCDQTVLEDKAYPAHHSPRGIMTMVDLLDASIINCVTPKLLKNFPNTYAYTKSLSEDLVATFKDKLPIVIARPSIVTGAISEPYPGWVEGYNGPTGLMIAAARGVVHSMHCNPDYKSDIVPVDIAINALVALAWERGRSSSSDILYTNVTVSPEHLATWGVSVEEGREIFQKYPLSMALWCPTGSIKSNYYYHKVCVFFLHLLPALLIDGLLILFRRKPFMMHVQKRINAGLELLQYYTTKQWVFKNDRLLQLSQSMSEYDRQTFFVVYPKDLTNHEYFTNMILGMRRYLLKESDDLLPKSRTLHKRLRFMNQLLKIIAWASVLWMLWCYCDHITNGIHFIFEQTKSVFVKQPTTRGAFKGPSSFPSVQCIPH